MTPTTRPNPARSLLVTIAVLALCGAALSALLVQHHSGAGAASRFVQAVCGASAGCDAVNRSAASAFLGLPLALWGFWLYGAIAVISLIALSPGRALELSLLRILALAALGVDLGLLAYSIFGIGALCSLCVATYGITAAIALLAFLAARRAPVDAPPAHPRVGLAHVFGGIAVLACGVVFSGRSVSLPGAAGGGATPEDALVVAWNAFHKTYRETPERAVDIEGSPRRGSTRPVLDMALFADFQCPHCKRSAERLIRFTDAHRDSVRLVFKHYPLDESCNPLADTVHAGACFLARGAEAAARQNRFWHFHGALFENQETWARGVAKEQLKSLAESSGLDLERFARDLESPDVAALVKRDIDEANERLDVTATPTLFINGRKLKSIPIDDFLEELLLKEATRLKPIGLDLQRAARVRAGQ